MKNSVFIVFALAVLAVSCNTLSKQTEKINSIYNSRTPDMEIIFTNEENLPSKILMDEDYFETSKNIFFILSDYRRSYSRLVEYNTQENKIEKIIYESKQNEIISEYQCGNGSIIFSTISRDGLFSHDIYLYGIRLNLLNKINDHPLNKTAGILPLSIKMDANFIVWVEQDFTYNASIIKYYDIEHKEEGVINISPFDDSKFKVTTFFVNVNNGTIIYDRPKDKKKEIVIYDLKNKMELDTISQMDDVVLYYSGLLNNDYKYLVLYAQTLNEDILYIHDLIKKTDKKIVGFYPQTLVYDDILMSKGLDVFYNIQLNVSGNINEHYFGEIYHLHDYTMEKIEYSFNLYMGNKYSAFLKFDKNPRIRNIHFELFLND